MFLFYIVTKFLVLTAKGYFCGKKIVLHLKEITTGYEAEMSTGLVIHPDHSEHASYKKLSEINEQ